MKQAWGEMSTQLPKLIVSVMYEEQEDMKAETAYRHTKTIRIDFTAYK